MNVSSIECLTCCCGDNRKILSHGRVEKCGIWGRKCQAYEKGGYSHKKHYCGYGSEYVFVVTVQNSFIAYAERNENTNEI